MFKKTLAMLLALLMMLSLAACVINIHDGDPDDGKKQEQTTKDPDPTKDPERTGEPQETEDPADAKFDEFKKTATIEETVLYNDNGIVITAKDLTYEDSGVTLNVLLENNRDEELSFSSVNSTSVNGYMLYGGNLNCDVAAGEKADGEMYISYNEMRLHGIYELAELGLQFTVEDYSDFKAETDFVILKTSAFDSYTFNPNGFQDAVTSNAAKNELDYSVDFFGTEELYNSSGIRLVSQTMISEDDGMMLYLEFVNDSSDTVLININRVALKGLDINRTYLAETEPIPPSTHRAVTVNLTPWHEEEYRGILGITEIGSVSFDLILENTIYDVIDKERVNVNVSDASASFDNTGIEAYNDYGIRLVFKGFAKDPYGLTDRISALFIVENTGEEGRIVGFEGEYVSINELLSGAYGNSQTLLNGEFAILDIEITNELDISDFSEITGLEFELVIQDENYRQISEPTISVQF